MSATNLYFAAHSVRGALVFLGLETIYLHHSFPVLDGVKAAGCPLCLLYLGALGSLKDDENTGLRRESY